MGECSAVNVSCPPLLFFAFLSTLNYVEHGSKGGMERDRCTLQDVTGYISTDASVTASMLPRCKRLAGCDGAAIVDSWSGIRCVSTHGSRCRNADRFPATPHSCLVSSPIAGNHDSCTSAHRPHTEWRLPAAVAIDLKKQNRAVAFPSSAEV